MEDGATSIRDALGAFLADEAGERVARWRGDPAAASEEGVCARHRWLVSRGAFDLVGELAERGALAPSEIAATFAHLARLQAWWAQADLRAGLAALTRRPADGRGDGARLVDLLRALEEGGPASRKAEPRLLDLAERVAVRAREVRQRADERVSALPASAQPHPDAADRTGAVEGRAEALLAATDGIGEEAIRWLLEREGEPPTWSGLARAGRARRLDGLCRPEGRFRRVAGAFSGGRFERDARARVHVERAHRGVTPRVRLALRAVPGDIRIAPGPLELGVLSELAAAEGFGRALALCLASPGLPPALRFPVVGTVSRAMGGLAVQVAIDPRTLAGDGRVPPRDRERVARTLGGLVLLRVRLDAAAVLASACPDAREGAAVLERAVGVQVPPPLAELVALPRDGNGARLRGSLGALAAWAALRELYDEDWYRNPRVEEALRSGCGRGGGLSIEAFVAELGGGEGAAEARARELFAT